jgi:hypothetical protein
LVSGIWYLAFGIWHLKFANCSGTVGIWERPRPDSKIRAKKPGVLTFALAFVFVCAHFVVLCFSNWISLWDLLDNQAFAGILGIWLWPLP